MSAYVPSADPANALVNDLGLSVGQIAVSQSKSSLGTGSLANLFTGDANANKSIVYGLQPDTNFNYRYGTISDTKNPGAPWVPGYWSCQATGFVKSCLVQGFTGNNKTYESEVDLRVYREVIPGAEKFWNADYKRVSTPILPFSWYLGLETYGSGSIPVEMASSCPDSFYHVLFVGWQDDYYTATAPSPNKRFALIDYYPVYPVGALNFKSDSYTTAIINTTNEPKNNSSASGSKALASNFIKNEYHVGGSVGPGNGTSGNGRILLPQIPGQENVKYYLTDGSPGTLSKQSSRLPSRVVSEPSVKPPFYKGSDIVKIDETNSSSVLDYQTPSLSYTNSLPNVKLYHSEYYINSQSGKRQLLLSSDTRVELNSLMSKMGNLNRTSLEKIGDIVLQAGVNYIPTNLSFTDGAITKDNWGLDKRSSSDEYLGGHIVDGADITGSVLRNDLEGNIAGQEARSNYWYIIPGWQRVDSGNAPGASHRNIRQSAIQARDAIKGVPNAELGKHGGKFLKSIFPSSVGVEKYRNAFEQNLQVMALTNFAGKKFTGYFAGYEKRGRFGQPMYPGYEFQFSLEGLSGLPSSISGFSSTSPQFSTSNTAPVTKEKYLKIINDAKSALAAGTNVTYDSIKSVFSGLLGLGLPLASIKAEVLKRFGEGKIAYLTLSKNLSPEAAMKEWMKDPLYLAIKGGTFTSNSSGSGSNSGGSSGGSSGGGSGGGNKNNNKNKNKNKNNKNGNNKNNQGGNADTAGASSQNDTVKITVTRGLAGYVKGVRSTGNTRSRPTLIQTYEGMKSSKQINGTPIRSFEFPFVPSQVNYTGLGINWTEIERTGSYPIVDWSSFQLLKISFNFDIVSMAQENQAGFGLYYSCEDQIMELREMAQAPYPVTFLNMDKFMQDEIRWPSLNTGRGIEFVIQEFSVTATQRTSSNPTALVSSTVPNQISRASCTMTLQEIPIENVDIVQMPPIRPCKKECDKDKIITQQNSTHPLFSTTILTFTG